MSRSAADDRTARPQSEPDSGSTRRSPEPPPVHIVAVTDGDLARAVIEGGRLQTSREPGAERPSRHTGGDGWANQCHHGTR